jgi:hypothetical protein
MGWARPLGEAGEVITRPREPWAIMARLSRACDVWRAAVWRLGHRGNTLIGEIRLDRVDLRDRRASLAIGIGDSSQLGKGLGIGSFTAWAPRRSRNSVDKA